MEAKTIEDRANAWAENHRMEMSYHQGATDQRKIDIDKACEWIKNNMAHFWHTDEDSIVSNFRKAMEEYPPPTFIIFKIRLEL